MTKSFRRLAAVAAIAGLALAMPAAGARAAELGPDAENGPKTVARYAGCVLGLSLAVDVSSGLVAFMACVRLFFDEFPK